MSKLSKKMLVDIIQETTGGFTTCTIAHECESQLAANCGIETKKNYINCPFLYSTMMEKTYLIDYHVTLYNNKLRSLQ